MDFKTLLSLLRNVQVKTFEKGEVVIEANSKKEEAMLIRRGLIRSYKGHIGYEDETTFQLYAENDILGNNHAIIFNEPSAFTYQALEKTKVYSIDFSYFSQKSTSNRTVIGKKIIKQSFTRVESLIFLSPEERYLKYLKDHPSIVSRAPDKYIAHVLGITPSSLSRIRKRMSSRKR